MLSGVDSLEVVTDSEHHGRDGVVVELDTERDDFLTTLTISRLGHADIGVGRGKTSDVSACQKNRDTVIVSGKAEV
jgi:hypothetical protein